MKVSLSDGRELQIEQGGNAAGVLVVVHHGSPGGPVLDPSWIQDAERRGLRLVTYARPGYADSTEHPGRTVADAASDVAAIADHLGVERFLTVGLSGGGPHALACAALLPERVVAAASLAGVAPHDAPGLDFLAGMGQGNLDEYAAAARDGVAGLRALFTEEAAKLQTTSASQLVEAMAPHLTEVDAAVLRGPLSQTLSAQNRTGLRHGPEGWVEDMRLLYLEPWGFDPTSIRVPVIVWQGRHDAMVPYGHGVWLAEHIPGATDRLSDEDGHLTLWSHRMPEVHSWLLDKWNSAHPGGSGAGNRSCDF